MTEANLSTPAAIQGITFYQPLPGALLLARDGKVNLPYGDIQIPLLKEDFASLAGNEPSYDMVGSGLYHALRVSPDSAFASEYASLLKIAYPHILAELATHLVMLDKKDVDLPYIDRKITYLKIFSLLEPDNYRFPLEIGGSFLEKGLSLAALNQTTMLLYQAEKYLVRAESMKPDDLKAKAELAEISFLLGRYDRALSLWSELNSEFELPPESSAIIAGRVKLISSGKLPPAPAVDYLQAVGVAMEAFTSAEYEEAAAIILDALEALSLFEEFPLAEIYYVLGLCYVKLDIPLYAEQYFNQALLLSPAYEDARLELMKLTGKE